MEHPLWAGATDDEFDCSMEVVIELFLLEFLRICYIIYSCH
jgi:hypothetical protein